MARAGDGAGRWRRRVAAALTPLARAVAGPRGRHDSPAAAARGCQAKPSPVLPGRERPGLARLARAARSPASSPRLARAARKLRGRGHGPERRRARGGGGNADIRIPAPCAHGGACPTCPENRPSSHRGLRHKAVRQASAGHVRDRGQLLGCGRQESRYPVAGWLHKKRLDDNRG